MAHPLEQKIISLNRKKPLLCVRPCGNQIRQIHLLRSEANSFMSLSVKQL